MTSKIEQFCSMVGDFEIAKMKSINRQYFLLLFIIDLRFLISHHLIVLIKPNTTNNLSFFNKNFNYFFREQSGGLEQIHSHKLNGTGVAIK